ncbi:hypothetical protein LSH36_89g04026 [Paralvinella palmiformis]|uniref:RRM domain-containing protein n=1 Tax=Paralvinella palmiformis TaxID=53620 RepID=A0AAD9NAC5_9ANNE|nr:hypothetical protein LSH36_89g04026 [Paralvinella palmiformis]
MKSCDVDKTHCFDHDKKDLKDYMRQAGEVTYADAHKQRKNEGIVEFATYSDMKSALDKLDDTEINGRRIRLIEDRPRRSRRSAGLFCYEVHQHFSSTKQKIDWMQLYRNVSYQIV